MKSAPATPIILLLALIALVACSNPRNAVITKDNRYKALDDVGPQLSEDERRELIEAHARSVFGKYSIEGETVNQVLSEQKKFDDDKTAPLFGSWICSLVIVGQFAYPNDRVVFTFNPNHTETVLFTAPKRPPRRERYHFGFDGDTLDEGTADGSYLDWVDLSRNTLQITRGMQKLAYNGWVTVMWPYEFTCKRAPRNIGASGLSR
jgi:hypothetical protein